MRRATIADAADSVSASADSGATPKRSSEDAAGASGRDGLVAAAMEASKALPRLLVRNLGEHALYQPHPMRSGSSDGDATTASPAAQHRQLASSAVASAPRVSLPCPTEFVEVCRAALLRTLAPLGGTRRLAETLIATTSDERLCAPSRACVCVWGGKRVASASRYSWCCA